MKKHNYILLALSMLVFIRASAADWDGIPVPANAGDGKTWELIENVSDDFNYIFEETESQVDFGNGKWYNFYHNTWNGPGRTYWQQDHTSVNGAELVLRTSDSQDITKGFNCANTGCITSNNRVGYPVFVEGSISVANVAIASDIWMLSPDDKEEIDIIECYGGHEWFGQFIHLSHHSFIRDNEPRGFHDYQPRDTNSWWPYDDISGGSWGDYCWNNGNRQYIRVGVYWIGPNHFEYYVNGILARVMYEHAMATYMYGTWEYTYYNELHPVGTKDEYGTNLGGMPTTTDGYADVTHYTETSEYNFATLQAASAASNQIKVVDPGDYQGEDVGFTREMDIIINVEIQGWHLTSDWLIDDADLARPISDMHVDWLRAYKPVDAANNVTTVSVTPGTISTGVGQERKLSVEVLPSNAIDPSITWSSDNPAIAAVDQNGVIKGISVGLTTVRATNTSGASSNVVGTCAVSVQQGIVAIPVSNIALATPRFAAEPGDVLALSATFFPADATDQSLTWTSSKPDVATVNPTTGLVTGMANGSVTITARANDGSGVSQTIDLEFEKYIPAVIDIHDAEKYTSQAFVAGDDLTISCDYHAGTGNILDETGVTFLLRRMTADWSEVVASYTVSDLSTVGTQSGSATGTIRLNVPTSDAIGSDFYFLYVYINKGGFSSPGLVPITIVGEEIPITEVTITPSTTSVGVGQWRQLSAHKLPEFVTDPTINWTSDNPSVLSVDQDGIITGDAPGTTTIRATANSGAEGTCSVTVQQDPVFIPVTSIVASTSSQTGLPGDNISLSYEAYPKEATDRSATWSSSNPAIASVDAATGNVTAHDYGSVLMIASASDGSGVSESIELRIETAQEASITVPDEDTLKYVNTVYAVDGEINVTADYHAGTGNTIGDNGVTFWLRRVTTGWAVDKDSDIIINDLSATGKVFGTASASIPLDGVIPSDQIGSDFYFLWISANGASINGPGFHPITITDDPISVTGVTVSVPHTILSAPGETVIATAEVTPAEASNKTVTWNSSNPAVAPVNPSTGVITAVANGTATITAVSNDNSTISDNVDIRVDIVNNCEELTGIIVSPSSAEIGIGETQALSFSAIPACQTSSTSVTWISNNTSVATVNATTGVVTGIAPGNAIITATTTDGIHTATSNITVKTVPVEGISVAPIAANVVVNSSLQLTATITPSDATNQNVRWSSDNSGVTVDANGLVTGVTLGAIATITAITEDGDFPATIEITVVDTPTDIVIEAESFTSTTGTIDDSPYGGPGLGVNNSGSAINYVNSNDQATYSIHVPQAGEYTIVYNISTPMDNAQVQFVANGVTVTTNVPNNGEWDAYTPLEASENITLASGSQTVTMIASGSNAWQFNLDKITLTSSGTPVNNAPIANAGTDQDLAYTASTATLNGSGADADGDALSYSWTQHSGSTVTISNATNATASISGLTEGSTYEFELEVSDGQATDTDIVKITVEEAPNNAPIANAGDDQTLDAGTTTATLSGSGTDADGDALTYTWSVVSGGATLSNTSSATASISGLSNGNTYELALEVSDGEASDIDNVVITVRTPVNHAPIANAGADQNLSAGTTTATLSGSGTDADGDALTYTWAVVRGGATLSNASSATASVNGLSSGNTYEFTLEVSDGLLAHSDNVFITVESDIPSEQTPYNGTPAAIPGSITSVEFDNGGQDIAYNDTDAANSGSGPRQDEGVDTEYRITEGNIGWIRAGEWYEYTVDVEEAGNYTIDVMVASIYNTGSFHIEFDGADVTGTQTVASTGNWGTFTAHTITGVILNAGEQVMRIAIEGTGFNIGTITYTKESDDNNGESEPIKIEAESLTTTGGTFNDAFVGGPGLGFGVTATGVNYVNNDDYANYSVNVPEGGAYEVVYHISSPMTGSTITISSGSESNTTTVNNNGQWDAYQDQAASGTINLSAGDQTITLTAGAQTWTWNLDYFTVQRVGAAKAAKSLVEPLSAAVYPNPASNMLNIALSGEIVNPVNIAVYNHLGSMVLSEQIETNIYQLSISDLPSGMYILQVSGSDITETKRFIKE